MVDHEEKWGFGLVLASRRKFLAFPCIESVEGASFPLFRMRSVTQIVRNAFVYRVVVKYCLLSCCFCLSSCCFAYRVVKLTKLLSFVELTSFVYWVVTLCSSTLLCLAYRVVSLINIVVSCLSSCKLAKVLSFLSKLSCFVCCVGSLPNLAIFNARFPFNLIFVQNNAMRCKNIKYNTFLNKSCFIPSCFLCYNILQQGYKFYRK